jgi:ankyrin repeat protein
MELFFKAVERGDEEEVSRRLDAEPVLLEKKQGFNGLKPVAVAAQARQLGVVKLLVQRGANVHARNGLWKQTALHRAAGEGHEKVVAFLLNNGARADTLDTSRSTPLQVAFRDGHIGVVKMLLQHMGAQGLVERSRMRWTALMEAAAGGQLDVAQIQPQHMGEQGLEETDENGKTILSWAVHGGNEETVALLLSQGAQATGRDKAGKTPLIWASSHGHLGVVRLLLQHTGGQGLDEADTTGLTALHWAAFKGHEELVVFLLSQGVQANSSDRCGKTPLLWASSRGHLSVVRVLLQHTGGQGLDDRGMAGCTALHSAAYAGREEVAAFLLSQGAQPNATDDQGSTPLIKAATNGRLSAAKVLLQHVGEEGRQARDHLGKTALHCAVYGKCEEMLRVLLLAGVDPSIRDARGRRPEEVARRGGPRGCVSVFEVRMLRGR